MKSEKDIYICGALFKIGDVKERIVEEERLRAIGFDKIFNPCTQSFNKDKTSLLPTAQDIFLGDTRAVIESNIIVAELDNGDEGVMAELGVAYGLNYITDCLRKAMSLASKSNDEFFLDKCVYNICKNIPHKEIYGHLTDIRVTSAGEYDGVHIPYGYNQYVIGMIESIDGSGIYNNKEDMYKDLSGRL